MGWISKGNIAFVPLSFNCTYGASLCSHLQPLLGNPQLELIWTGIIYR